MKPNRQDLLVTRSAHELPAPYPADHERNLRRVKRRSRRNTILLLLFTLGLILYWNELPIPDLLEPEASVRDIPPVTGLHPIVAAKQNELIRLTEEAGITILITDGFRSKEEQDALYRQGRSDEGPVVTHAQGGESYHNYGLAIDFALRTDDGDVIWDLSYDGNGNGESDWMEVVSIAKDLGFTWGGDWASFRDYPHLQMDFGYSIRELKKGKRPPSGQDTSSP
ncbi:M15 family peptidase [Paenibacillus sambharensis]|uniref:M15 family peptidase n=1 Tax=Paenibacillus sambharensis TaxID=1803190 RepID=A0A2W1LCL9_9BACL|nr:M15 family metallopeptidase [Paenibacillus sambharensis]PZD96429.1 M15 family peptidase [Paenibacillus sambharensis]